MSLISTKQFVFRIITLFHEEENDYHFMIMRCDRSQGLFKRLILH